MGVDSDDEEFVANGSDDDAITGKPTEAVKCKRCASEYVPSSKKSLDYTCIGLCDACSEEVKARVEKLKHGGDKDTSEDEIDGGGSGKMTSSSAATDSFFSDNMIQEDDKGGNDIDANKVNGIPDNDGSEHGDDDKNDNIVDSSSEKNSNGGDESDVEDVPAKTTVDDDVTFDVMLGAVFSCGSKSGRVKIHDHEYEFSACPLNISGRGGGTTLIVTEFSKSVPELFGYYYYGGLYTRLYACMAFTMTECGNLFMGIMETMCYKCRTDPVIYFPSTDTCRIVNDRMWRKQFKLNCILILTIDIEKAKRYIINNIFIYMLMLYVVHLCLCCRKKDGYMIPSVD